MSKASKPPSDGKPSGTRRFRQTARRPGYWAEAKRRQRAQANEEYGKAAVTRWRKLEKRAHRALTQQAQVLIPASGDTFRVLGVDGRLSRIALGSEDAFIAGFGRISRFYSIELCEPHVEPALAQLVAGVPFGEMDIQDLFSEAWAIAGLLRVEAGRAFGRFRHPIKPAVLDTPLAFVSRNDPRDYLAVVARSALLADRTISDSCPTKDFRAVSIWLADMVWKQFVRSDPDFIARTMAATPSSIVEAFRPGTYTRISWDGERTIRSEQPLELDARNVWRRGRSSIQCFFCGQPLPVEPLELSPLPLEHINASPLNAHPVAEPGDAPYYGGDPGRGPILMKQLLEDCATCKAAYDPSNPL